MTMNKGLEAARNAPRKQRPSMRKAVNAKCRECTYDQNDRGSAAQQIAVCIATDCPLHPIRPVTCSVIPQKLLDHWGIQKAQLCERAQPLVREADIEEGQDGDSTDADIEE